MGPVPLEVPNSGFEQQDEQGLPRGWGVGRAESYRAAVDCNVAYEGRCSLRFEGDRTSERRFLAASRRAPVDRAAGHVAVLSGMICTENVEGGRAGFWMRIDGAAGRMIALENMQASGPSGNTAWRRYTVALDVPPEAKQIVFGPILSGSGRAWFDDVHLEFDPSTRVAGRPSRVEPARDLEDDAALALAPAAHPHVNSVLREEVRARARPLRSLVSDDFSDLQFLKPLLAGKRIVQLGESAHGVAEFDWMKVRLVKFLHREMGFDVIAFESSLTGCEVADRSIGRAAPIDVMRECIFRVWHSSETLGLFEALDASRRAGDRFSLAGFDVQDSGSARPAVSALLVRLATLLDASLGSRVADSEGKLDKQHVRDRADEAAGLYADLASRLAAERERLLSHGDVDARDFAFALQEASSRARLVRELAAADARQATLARDEGMADNLDFLLAKAFPDRKVIVWAHNFHVQKVSNENETARTMGTWVNERHGSETYTIGLFMGRGVAAKNDRKLYDIAAPAPDSLEAALASAGWKRSFIDVAGTSHDGWAWKPISFREWGVEPGSFVPARAFDALVYIDTVTPPDYR